jgi:antitoxin ParD1/3/4
MQIVVSSEVEQIIRNEMATGKYLSENEVLLEAVQLLSARDRQLEELRRQVQVGRDQIDRGEYIELDETSLNDLFNALQERGQRRYAERRQPS